MTPTTAKKLAATQGCRFIYLTGNEQGKPFWCLQRDDLQGEIEDIYSAELRDMTKEGFMKLVGIVKDSNLVSRGARGFHA